MVAIRIFLAYAAHNRSLYFIWHVKTVFLHGTLKEDVYACQPEGFINAEHPSHVYKLKKVLCGLKQAPKAWVYNLCVDLMKASSNVGCGGNDVFSLVYQGLCALGTRAKPAEKHSRRLKGSIQLSLGTVMGLWYTKDSGFELTRFSDADYAGCKDTFKSTSVEKFLRRKLGLGWSRKSMTVCGLSTQKQESVSIPLVNGPSPLDADTVNGLWLSFQQDSYLL
ncbi:retrovirus-related pol polyprotein from transposon TNT 1-94 [Tanacetum coccineum]